MASKRDFLLQIFEKNQFRHLRNSLPKLRESDFIKSGLAKEALSVYNSLGGLQVECPINTPEWDFEFETFAVKIDDDLHFNRYRAITLKSETYQQVNFFPLENYKRFCRQYESDCLKAGKQTKLWTDKQSELHFGESNEPGDLALKGAAKWKERAYQDFVEDLIAMFLKIKLIRLSIHENIMVNNRLVKLDSFLISQSQINEKYLFSFLQRKISNP